MHTPPVVTASALHPKKLVRLLLCQVVCLSPSSSASVLALLLSPAPTLPGQPSLSVCLPVALT
jgi:hypothetical protein